MSLSPCPRYCCSISTPEYLNTRESVDGRVVLLPLSGQQQRDGPGWHGERAGRRRAHRQTVRRLMLYRSVRPVFTNSSSLSALPKLVCDTQRLCGSLGAAA